MRTLHIIGFRTDGSCDFIAKPDQKIEDVIKCQADLATSKFLGEFVRAELFDSEKGRTRTIFANPQAKPQPEKSKMKKIASLIALAALCFGINAGAQSQSLSLGTNGIAVHPSTANDIEDATVADLKGTAGLCVQVSCNNDSTTAAALGVYFVRSVDGVTYENKAVIGALLPTTATAGASSVSVTNLYTTYPLARYWKLSYITNNAAATAVITNVAVKYSTLPAR